MRKKYTWIIISTLLIIFTASAVGSMREKSPVGDEVSHHIATGYSFLRTGDFRLNSTQPPLIEELAALPLLFLKLNLPLDHPSWDAVDRATFGFQFLYRYGNDVDRIVFWSRIPIVILGLLGGLLVFKWAGELYGERAGMFALFLYAFSPNIIAYSRVSTSDMGVTVLMVLALYRFCKFTRKPTRKNIVLAGIALGLAEASKLTALILLPFFAVIVVWMSLSKRTLKYITAFGIMALLCYLVVFITYFGEIQPLLKNNVDVPEKIGYISKASDRFFVGNESIKEKAIDFALHRPVPLATYTMNILSTLNMMFGRRLFKVFLFGRYYDTGQWYYYPVVFLLKTPLPTLILLLLTLFFFKKARSNNRFEENMIVCFVAIFGIASLTTKLQLSVRYILPLYPFCFILISRLVNAAVKRKMLITCIVGALCLWYVSEAWNTYPHHISYFNQLAKGPDNGYRILRNSNSDYGQDLPALGEYLKRNNIDEVTLAYCGTADPAAYGIKWKQQGEGEERTPANSVYAISANYLNGFFWTEQYAPVAKAGYSIFIYDFRE